LLSMMPPNLCHVQGQPSAPAALPGDVPPTGVNRTTRTKGVRGRRSSQSPSGDGENQGQGQVMRSKGRVSAQRQQYVSPSTTQEHLPPPGTPAVQAAPSQSTQGSGRTAGNSENWDEQAAGVHEQQGGGTRRGRASIKARQGKRSPSSGSSPTGRDGNSKQQKLGGGEDWAAAWQ
jgi:hypothetical protein